MNPVKARQVILASVASTVVIVVAATAVQKKSLPNTKTLVGLGFGFLFLSVTADFAPQVAAPMSVLMMLSAMVVPLPGEKKSAATVFLGSIG